MGSLKIVIDVILLFFVLVTVHEWGHFYFAKRAGILIREFAIGFGPKLLSLKRGETTYTLRLLPIGGYVRMAGEDPEVLQVQEGQTVALELSGTPEKVSHIYLDRMEERSHVIVGETEHIDLERKLKISLLAEGEVQDYAVHPQAMIVSNGATNQIAPWDRQFGSKSIGQRLSSIFAGPLMNFILAFILFVTVAFMTGIPQSVKVSQLSNWSKLKQVQQNSPAQKAGVKPGDVIVSVNGKPIGTDTTLLTSLIQKSAGEQMNWVVRRDGNMKKISITPEKTSQGTLVGVGLDYSYRKSTIGEGIQQGWTQFYKASGLILTGFKQLVTLHVKLDDLGGPVRIVQMTGEQAHAGKVPYLFWMAMLSLNLGLFNLLPVPALDGSRLLFILLEWLRGKPIDPNKESMVHFIGFAMLMLLMLAVTYNDILRLIKG